MSQPLPEPAGPLSPLPRRVDRVCNQFEAAWRAGTRARVEEFLGDWDGPERRALLAELVPLEAYYRRRLGEECRADEYQARFPDLDPAWLARAPERSEDGPARTPGPAVTVVTGPARPVVPGYEVLGELGRGGMGVVYKARDVRLGRLVALKLIAAGGDTGEAERARFKTEAEAAARLQHPNVVQVYEVGEHDGRPYLALEFCPGGNLAAKLAGTPLPPREAAQLLETLARAVQAAHDRHVVHRDLKPANVLLAEGGTPKVTDFGLAKKLDVPAGLTQSGAILGTPSYMAPEQARGQIRDVGPATDVYGLGAVGYELLTGRPPFRAATAADTLLQVMLDEPVPPGRLQPGVPRDLETVCRKCLHKDPHRRYAGAGELADDLRRFLDGKPVRARPAPPWERGWKAARRRPALTALGTVSVVAAVLLIAVQAVNNGRITAEVTAKTAALGEKEGALVTARAEKANAEKALAQQRRTSYFQRITLAHRQLQAGEVAEAEALLDLCPPDLRGWEWYYLQRQCHLDLLTVPMGGQAQPSPDGQRLAVLDVTGVLTLRDRKDRTYRWAVQGSLGFRPRYPFLAFSADGKHLACAAADQAVKLLDAATGREVASLAGHAGALNGVAFRPDGRRVASASDDGTVRLWDPQTRKELFALRQPRRPFRGVAFSPDGKLLAAAGPDREVTLCDTTTGEPVRSLRGHPVPVTAVAFGLGANMLASADEDGTVLLWDTATGRDLFTLRGHTGGVLALAFSPQSNLLASGSLDHTVRVWLVGAVTALRTLRGHSSGVTGVAWGEHGTQLVSAALDGTVKVWDLGRDPETVPHSWPARALDADRHFLAGGGADPLHVIDARTGAVVRTLANPQTPYRCAWSRDGRRVAVANADRSLRLWDLPSGRDVVLRDAWGSSTPALACSPDGRLVAATTADKTVTVWQGDTGQPVVTRTAPQSLYMRPAALAFSPAGTRLAAASFYGSVYLWDTRTDQEVATLPGHPGAAVEAVAFDATGGRLATAGSDGAVKVWDLAGGTELLRVQGPSRAGRTNGVDLFLAFSPDGQRLVAADAETLRVWDTLTGQEALTVRPHFGAGEATGLAFSPDGRRLLTAGERSAVKVWDATPCRQSQALRGHSGCVFSVACSPDGRQIASAGDGTVRLWDAATGEEVMVLRGHANQVTAVAFSPDGRRLAFACLDRTVKVWETSTGQQVLSLAARPREGQPANPVWRMWLVFSPDGGRLTAVDTDSWVESWDAADGKPTFAFPAVAGPGPPVTSTVAWAPDGEHLAAMGAGGLFVWNATTGKHVRSGIFGSFAEGNGIAFSPDGRYLVGATRGAVRLEAGVLVPALPLAVKVWDVETGKQVFAMATPAVRVSCVAFSPDGRTVAVGDGEGAIKLWEPATGKESRTVREHVGAVTALAFTRDGQTLVSAGEDRTVRIWPLGAEQPPEPAARP